MNFIQFSKVGEVVSENLWNSAEAILDAASVPGSPGEYLLNDVCALRVYKRSPLSSAQILSDHEAAKGGRAVSRPKVLNCFKVGLYSLYCNLQHLAAPRATVPQSAMANVPLARANRRHLAASGFATWNAPPLRDQANDKVFGKYKTKADCHLGG